MENFYDQLGSLVNRTTTKAFFIAGLTALLMIPLNMIDKLVFERNQRMKEVQQELGQLWGHEMELIGPILVAPSLNHRTHRVFLPSQLKVNIQLNALERYRGIFRIPTFEGSLLLNGKFEPDPEWGNYDLSRAKLVVFSQGSDQRAAQLESVGFSQRIPFEAKENKWGFPGAAFEAPITVYDTVIPEDGKEDPIHFEIKGTVLGSGQFLFRPLGQKSEVSMDSNWAAPSFSGEILPRTRTVDDNGFQAQWSFNLPGKLQSYPLGSLNIYRYPTMGTRLVQDVSMYQQVTRTTKYGILIIVLTFATFFLFELAAGIRIHVVQYLLVGCALVLFYLLLLSTSEHLTFGWAYLIAVFAAVSMISVYIRAILSTTKHAIIAALGMASLYGLLYVILQAEHLALITGSWALFVILALLMFLTRKLQLNQSAANSLKDKSSGKTQTDVT